MIVDLFSSVYVWTAIAVGITIHFLLFPRLRQSPIPVVNKFKNDFLRRRAYTEYSSNAKELLARGLRKHRGPIGILVPGGTKIVLPASFSDWVKSSKDLDHQQLVRDEYFASYPGFEAQYVAHHPDRMLIDIVRSKLAQNESTLLVIAQHLSRALSDHWGESDIWHKIDWHQDTTALVSRAAASVFIGPEKAEDPEWQRLIQSYVGEFFSAVGELHGWPSWLRPIAHWFLPHCCALRAMVPQARSVLRDVVRNRMEEAESARAAGQEPPAHNDAVAWTMAASTGANLEHGDVQLALGMVALFTTSEALRQVLIDIARDSNLAEALREEIHSRFTENGFKLSTLFKLELMDSVLKESQRCAAPLGK